MPARYEAGCSIAHINHTVLEGLRLVSRLYTGTNTSAEACTALSGNAVALGLLTAALVCAALRVHGHARVRVHQEAAGVGQPGAKPLEVPGVRGNFEAQAPDHCRSVREVIIIIIHESAIQKRVKGKT